MRYLLTLLLFISSLAMAATPTLLITSPVQRLAIGASTTVTFTFSEAVTGFDLTDANIKGNGQFTSVLSGSGASYSVTFQKITDLNSASIVVDNKSYSAVSDGSLGVYSTIGFNVQPLMYLKDTNVFNGALVEAVPQPSCPKVGEILVNADNTPAAPLNEKYFIKSGDGRAIAIKEVRFACLQRVLAGQKYVKTISPKVFETNNVHGAHNNSTLMPKVTQAYLQPLAGTTNVRVKPNNAGNCTLDASNVLVCGGTAYNGVLSSGGGGDFRISNIAGKIDFDDPIVFPGQKGRAHAHTFYGNNGVNYQTNSASLINSCVSLIAGGRANCTGYWMPSTIDTSTNTAIIPDEILIYYKGNLDGNPNVLPTPKGLKIIAGNPNRKPSDPENDRIDFTCFPKSTSGAPLISSKTIPACSGNLYDFIRFDVYFPTCVADNGKGGMVLDSPDHRSHLVPASAVYPVVNGKRTCPAAFPHPIPTITQVVDFKLKPGQNTATWRLSSDNYANNLAGGASLHADWWGGWLDYWMARMVDQCNKRAFNCGVNYIGMNDGVGVSNITTSADGLKAIITTIKPHLLEVSNADGTYPQVLGPNSTQKLLGKISGVSGVSAASYNFDINKNSTVDNVTGLKNEVPEGAQPLKILNANQIEFTLNNVPSTPINGPVDPNLVKVFWGESLCDLSDTCDQNYSDSYYKDKN